LPPAARVALDTGDIVQEAALHLLQRIDMFQPQHVGAMQAYLRQSVVNRIRDEIRRVGRRPVAVELTEEPPADTLSPLEAAIQGESYERYRSALSRLAARDRELVVARVEVQWSLKRLSAAMRP
jgi:RNA polymerase sigma factor (sigma-70 family)